MVSLRKYIRRALIALCVVLGLGFFAMPSASGDAPPPPEASNPSPSEPEPEVVQEQLPEEVIGRAVDCPDGTVGYIIDVDLNTNCVKVRNERPVLIPTEEPPATPTPEPPVEPSQPSETASPSPTTAPSTEPTPAPLPDCTDPLVECACDHFLDGCTGGNPPNGGGTPFSSVTAETKISEKAQATRTTSGDVVAIGSGITAFLVICVGAIIWDYRRTR